MNRAISATMGLLSTQGQNESAGGQANQPHLKFAINYREADVSKLIEEFIAAMQKHATSPLDVDVRSHLSRFADEFGDRLVKTITSAEIGEWLESLSVSAVSRKYDWGLMTLVFSFAVLKGYIKTNPVFELTRGYS